MNKELARIILNTVKTDKDCYYISNILEDYYDEGDPDFMGALSHPYYQDDKLIGFAFCYTYANPDYPALYEPEVITGATKFVTWDELKEVCA